MVLQVVPFNIHFVLIGKYFIMRIPGSIQQQILLCLIGILSVKKSANLNNIRTQLKRKNGKNI